MYEYKLVQRQETSKQYLFSLNIFCITNYNCPHYSLPIVIVAVLITFSSADATHLSYDLLTLLLHRQFVSIYTFFGLAKIYDLHIPILSRSLFLLLAPI